MWRETFGTTRALASAAVANTSLDLWIWPEYACRAVVVQLAHLTFLLSFLHCRFAVKTELSLFLIGFGGALRVPQRPSSGDTIFVTN